MFILHGKTYSPGLVEGFAEIIINTYKYESFKTIISFLQKAAAGDFGKFYGDPDIGTIREWFATYLQESIVPARERLHSERKENYDNQREQKKSLGELIRGSGEHIKTTPEKDFDAGKSRTL